VAERVTFLGRQPREAVEDLYRSHDVFLFPSFREPAGGVLYEAMRHGLPVITAARGGPDFIVDDSCGIRVPVTHPAGFATDIAGAVRQLAGDSALLQSMGQAARAKVLEEGLWPAKAARMVDLYQSILARSTAPATYPIGYNASPVVSQKFPLRTSS
jgi:glycosyltransferase involved in cell wall biosynthesis